MSAEIMMTPEMIEQIALANGFKLKEQPDGSMALNPYVFEFSKALLAASIPPAQSNIWKEAVLLQCMAVEGCYNENNPIATMNCLIDWHVRNVETSGGDKS